MNYSFLILRQVCLNFRIDKVSRATCLIIVCGTLTLLLVASERIRRVLDLDLILSIEAHGSIQRLNTKPCVKFPYSKDDFCRADRWKHHIRHPESSYHAHALEHSGASLQTQCFEEVFDLLLVHFCGYLT
jgi:hypothetical protein